MNQLLVPADTLMDTTSYLLVFVAWHLGGILATAKTAKIFEARSDLGLIGLEKKHGR